MGLLLLSALAENQASAHFHITNVLSVIYAEFMPPSYLANLAD